jgi:hypothetical protein
MDFKQFGIYEESAKEHYEMCGQEFTVEEFMKHTIVPLEGEDYLEMIQHYLEWDSKERGIVIPEGAVVFTEYYSEHGDGMNPIAVQHIKEFQQRYGAIR